MRDANHGHTGGVDFGGNSSVPVTDSPVTYPVSKTPTRIIHPAEHAARA
jgi:hypothetical protein